jgi:hypothetical protein
LPTGILTHEIPIYGDPSAQLINNFPRERSQDNILKDRSIFKDQYDKISETQYSYTAKSKI